MASYREEGETPGEQALWRGDRGKDITPDGCGLFGHAKPRDRAERGRGPCPGRDDCAISHIQPFRLAMPGPAGASNRAMFRGRTRSARLLKPCHVANWGGRDRRNRRTGAARSPAGARTRVCLFRWSEGGRRNGPLAAKRRSARPNPKPRKKPGRRSDGFGTVLRRMDRRTPRCAEHSASSRVGPVLLRQRQRCAIASIQNSSRAPDGNPAEEKTARGRSGSG